MRLQREEGSLAAGSAVVVMKFTQKQRDTASGEVEDEGYAEDYELEENLEVRRKWPIKLNSQCF